MDESVYRRIEELVRELLRAIGEDPDREGLRDTPRRVAKMLVEELLSGYFDDPRRYLKTFSVDEEEVSAPIRMGDVVVVNDVPVRSMCEHHMLPIIGFAHIAYIPEGRVLGLSKFVRIVNAFARRLQIQERLTEQIADFIYNEISPRGAMVVIEAYHLCTVVRGVREPVRMVTVATRGRFAEDPSLRSDVLTLIFSQRRGIEHFVMQLASGASKGFGQ